jgi:hypothetical protein
MKITTYDVENPGPDIVHTCGGVKLMNGIPILPA